MTAWLLDADIAGNFVFGTIQCIQFKSVVAEGNAVEVLGKTVSHINGGAPGYLQLLLLLLLVAVLVAG